MESRAEKVKVIDVRTPEEFAFVGHPAMAWNIPLAFVTYEMKDGKFVYGHRPNTTFVAQVREIARPGDVLLVTCRFGGRGAMAVNALATAGFTNAYNIVDGIEGDTIDDPESVHHGKRMKNGWVTLGALGLRPRSRKGPPRGRRLEADAVSGAGEAGGETRMAARAPRDATRGTEADSHPRQLLRDARQGPDRHAHPPARGGPAQDLRRAAREGRARGHRDQRLRPLPVGSYALGAGQGRAARGDQPDPRRSGRLARGRRPGRGRGDPLAQHYAENLDRLDPASEENLRSYYDDAQVAEILAYVRVITFGNLTGNTIDAGIGRLRRALGSVA